MAGTIIVTGAAGGLGGAIATDVLGRPEPHACIFTVRARDAPNTKPLKDIIASSSAAAAAAGRKQKDVDMAELDLSSLASVRAFAADVNARVGAGRLPPIRALVLNAAAIVSPFDTERTFVGGGGEEDEAAGGRRLEAKFAVNYLANFLLTQLLLGSMDREHGRIVWVSSPACDPRAPRNARYAQEHLPWDLEDLAWATRPREKGDENNDVMRRYGRSKLLLAMYMHQLQSRLNETPGLDKICVLGVDPGAMVHPNLLSRFGPFMRYIVGPAFMGYTKIIQHVSPNGVFRTVEKSAADITRAALALDDPVLGEYPKDLYFNGSQLEEVAVDSKDEERQKELWEFSVKLANLSRSDMQVWRDKQGSSTLLV